MTSFDPDLWKARAHERWWRGTQKTPSSASWALKLTAEISAINSISVVVDWCLTKGIEIIFCRRSGGIYYPRKKIKISSRASPVVQLYYILHECGHYLIGDKKLERYSMGYSQDDPNAKRTFHHRCDIVDEEFEAWFRGWKLAKRLGLNLNKESFDKTRTTMLRSYFKWALKSDGYTGNDATDEEDDDDEKS